jgi:formate--tetrahydrofolate ligase
MRNGFNFSYDVNNTIQNKVNQIVKKIYRGKGVEFTPEAKKQIAQLEKLGLDKLPVCIAKTVQLFG